MRFGRRGHNRLNRRGVPPGAVSLDALGAACVVVAVVLVGRGCDRDFRAAAGLGAGSGFAALLALAAFGDRGVCELAEKPAAGKRDQPGDLGGLTVFFVGELLNGEWRLLLVAAGVA